MSEYDKELQTGTEEYEKAIKPLKKKGEERQPRDIGAREAEDRRNPRRDEAAEEPKHSR